MSDNLIYLDKERIYLIRCINDSESFYKVGITGNTISRRYGTSIGGSRAMPYFYDVLIDEVIDFNEALNIEDIICSEFESHKPLIKFGGYLECLVENEDIIKRTWELIENGTT